MLEQVLRSAIERRHFIMGLCALLILWGIYSYQQLDVDAVPDITNVQVQINTRAEGYSPLETEQRITQPLENHLTGLPGMLYSRSLSRYGLSQITLVFTDGTDIYAARNLISNRLGSLRAVLPPDITAELGPVTTGIGEILTYQLFASDTARQPDGSPYDGMALRELQDWVIKPQLNKLPGIAEINSLGGFERQLHVIPDTRKMLAHEISYADIQQALLHNNGNRGSGFMEYNGQQFLIRSTGQLQTPADIARIALPSQGPHPLLLGDISHTEIGHALRDGTASANGTESVLGTAMLLSGSNAHQTGQGLRQRLGEIQQSLPPGVQLEVLYDRNQLIDKVMATVQKNLLEGAALVVLVLLLLLGSMRAALITAAVIPLAMLATLGGMHTGGVSANLMSLGALDFGLIVDGAVIIVENAVRRLGIARQAAELPLAERLAVVFEATREVIRPSLFGVMIITLVYLPLFALSGVEGKMFQPMAATVVMALLAALLLSLTFVPAAVALFPPTALHKTSRGMQRMQFFYQRCLRGALQHPYRVLLAALLFMLACATLAGRTGSEFVPSLNEGDIALHAMRIPGTSLQQSVAMQLQLEREIMRLPQVAKVFSKLGTAEVATDPMPPNVADTFVMLKPRNTWPDPDLSEQDLIKQLEAAILVLPGNNYEFTQPIQMRFNELISGVRADVGIMIMGDDLDNLHALASQAAALLANIPGARDIKIEQVEGLPVLTLQPDFTAMARYGIKLSELQTEFSAASTGLGAGDFYAGERRYPIQVRSVQDAHNTPGALQELNISLPGGGYAPLGELARLESLDMPAQISHENGKRRIVISANVRGRDIGSFMTDTKSQLANTLVLPPGYWLAYNGSFEQLQSATARLSLVVPLVLALILALLIMALGSVRDALLILSGIPFALCGGVLALWWRDIPFSISAAVGFIALSGIAVLNGLVLLSFIRARWQEWGNLPRAIIEGASTRLRPVLMTALVAALGFIPMALNTGTGAEVQRPLASVVIGGIISSTLLTLIILPVLYHLSYRPRGKT